jgi:hypothetical protein
MHYLAISGVYVDPATEVDTPLLNVPGYAVTGLSQRRSADRFRRKLHAFWVKQEVSAIPKMEEKSGHEHSSPVGRERMTSLRHREAIEAR